MITNQLAKVRIILPNIGRAVKDAHDGENECRTVAIRRISPQWRARWARSRCPLVRPPGQLQGRRQSTVQLTSGRPHAVSQWNLFETKRRTKQIKGLRVANSCLKMNP